MYSGVRNLCRPKMRFCKLPILNEQSTGKRNSQQKGQQKQKRWPRRGQLQALTWEAARPGVAQPPRTCCEAPWPGPPNHCRRKQQRRENSYDPPPAACAAQNGWVFRGAGCARSLHPKVGGYVRSRATPKCPQRNVKNGANQ